MSDEEDSSPTETYKSTINVKEGKNSPTSVMFNLLPAKGDTDVEDTNHPDVPAGMMQRVESHDKHLETLANIPIHQSARTGDIKSLESYLKTIPQSMLKKKVNAKDENRITPLHYAARYNHLEVAKKLVECGANVDARDEEDLTPLHYAARYKRERVKKSEMAQFLDEKESKLKEKEALPSKVSVV